MHILNFLLFTFSLSGIYTLDFWKFKEYNANWALNNAVINFYEQNFNAEIEFRFLENPEGYFMDVYGEDFRGIYRKSLSIERENFRLWLLDYYFTPGKGLIFSMTRDEIVKLDRFFEGIYFEYYAGRNSVKLFYGKPVQYINYVREKFYLGDSLTEFIGGILQSGLSKNLNIEIGYILNENYLSQTKKKDFYYSSINLNYAFLSFYNEFVFRKGYDENVLKDTSGYGEYSQLLITKNNFTLSLEFSVYDMLGTSYSLPPSMNHYGLSLTKGRNETSYRISFLFPLFEYFNFDLEFSNSFYKDEKEIKEIFGEVRFNREPFEITASYTDIHFLNAGIDVIERYEKKLNFELLFEKFSLTPGIVLEYRFRKDYITSLPEEYTEPKIVFQLLHSKGSVSYTYQSDKENTIYQSFELLYQFNYFLSVYFYAGRQRADIVCSGGMCRYEPAFEGIKLNINYTF